MNQILILTTLSTVLLLGSFGINSTVYANPFFEGGQFTPNGIEWCEENLPLYEILGEKFFEHHKHSLESRVCAALYEDPLWYNDGQDRIQKLIEKSRYYSQLEINESIEESQTGIIDTNPAANQNEIVLQGMTENGQVSVKLITTEPHANNSLSFDIFFLDSNSSSIHNVNYSVEAIQNEHQVMNSDGYSKNGFVNLSTLPLSSNEQVTINVTINGIGLPEDENNWSGPKGQIIMFNVVPEFGTIVMMIFIISIISSIVISRRSLVKF